MDSSLHTFLGGILIFALLYWFAHWATRTDPPILRFILNSSKARTPYDPMKFSPTLVRCVKFKLAQALKDHREASSLNEEINLFGFADDHTLLTKSGDVGVVLAVKGWITNA